uniref:Uncharacterized protein n=1 Tax=Anguilla anguilla TaxID=7936 RepID=A0A0E9S430_ANGAN
MANHFKGFPPKTAFKWKLLLGPIQRFFTFSSFHVHFQAQSSAGEILSRGPSSTERGKAP